MAFCITFGTQDFTSQLKGYEGITAQCHNCGNWSAHCISRWDWFTICFVPLIPLSTHKEQLVACNICRFMQDIRNRPDVQNMIGQNNAPPSGGGPPQGWGGGPQQYQQQGQPVYQQQQGGYPQGAGAKPPAQPQYA